MNQPDNEKLAAALVGGTPMAFKAYPDGSLVVIGPDGKKSRFTQEAVEKAKAALKAASSSKRPSSSSRAKKPSEPESASSGKNEPKKTQTAAKSQS